MPCRVVKLFIARSEGIVGRSIQDHSGVLLHFGNRPRNESSNLDLTVIAFTTDRRYTALTHQQFVVLHDSTPFQETGIRPTD
jgi:hypothetical protein